MLIKALSDYYDFLASNEKVLPPGYSKVNVSYKIALTKDGKIDYILDHRKKTVVEMANGKTKEKFEPNEVTMPERTQKPGIESNIIEHRPLYIFGLNLDKDQKLTPIDKTNKAKKSHESFVKINLDFIEGLSSPIIDAFRNFIKNWNPELETENVELLKLGKEYSKAGFAFCLSGEPYLLLHEVPEIKKRWEELRDEKVIDAKNVQIKQCAVCGEQLPIARIHNKIKGVYGGLSTGGVLIGYNNPSENSYGNEQSYNSNISENVMKKYTEAFNYLLSSSNHKVALDDITIVCWAMSKEERYENNIMAMIFQQGMDKKQTEQMLFKLLLDARNGKITNERLSLEGIDPNVDFYLVGLKPNSSRIAMKFIYRRRYGDILRNIAKFQEELQVSLDMQSISLMRIKKELISPKSTNDKVNPALLANIIESILYGTNYPMALLETIIRRIKIDEGSGKINSVRAGIIKAVINRNSKKEELTMGLNKENDDQAYLCGRMFAVLEKIQLDASKGILNRTIKDSYFAAASTRPAMVFPKLLRLAQNHLKKVEYSNFYNILIGEISDKLNGGYPERLLLKDQGKFMVGYYQQNKNLFEKKQKNSESEDK